MNGRVGGGLFVPVNVGGASVLSGTAKPGSAGPGTAGKAYGGGAGGANAGPGTGNQAGGAASRRPPAPHSRREPGC